MRLDKAEVLKPDDFATIVAHLRHRDQQEVLHRGRRYRVLNVWNDQEYLAILLLRISDNTCPIIAFFQIGNVGYRVDAHGDVADRTHFRKAFQIRNARLRLANLARGLA